MSPEIRISNNLIARVPDQTGAYMTIAGKPLHVNVDGINADNNVQQIILEAEEIGGKRILGLTQQGIGESNDPKRGDGKLPEISTSLLDRPIRISYKDRVWHKRPKTLAGPNGGGYYVESKRTYKNPRWVRGHEQG